MKIMKKSSIVFQKTASPIRQCWKKSSRCFDSHDNEMAAWPLNMPHRVENMTNCISVMTEYSTPESSMKNAEM